MPANPTSAAVEAAARALAAADAHDYGALGSTYHGRALQSAYQRQARATIAAFFGALPSGGYWLAGGCITAPHQIADDIAARGTGGAE